MITMVQPTVRKNRTVQNRRITHESNIHQTAVGKPNRSRYQRHRPVFNYSLSQYYTIRKSSQSLIFNCTYDGFPKGAIIGSVVISDCVQNHPSVWAEKGCWNWILKDAVLFDKPIINVKGKLSFWEYNMEE